MPINTNNVLTRICRHLRTLAVVVLVLGAGIGPLTTPLPASAQTPNTSAVAPEQVKELLETLKDESARNKLEQQLEALIAARKQAAAPAEKGLVRQLSSRTVDRLTGELQALGEDVITIARAVVDVPRAYEWLREGLTDSTSRTKWLEFLWRILTILAAGLIAEMIIRTALRGVRARMDDRSADNFWVRSLYLLFRTLLDVVPIAGFAGAAYIALPSLAETQATALAGAALINASVLSRAILAFARMVLVPKATTLRLVPINDVNATYLFLWVSRLTRFGVYGYFLTEAALSLGMDARGHRLLLNIVWLILALLVIVLILQSKQSVRTWLKDTGQKDAGTESAGAVGSVAKATGPLKARFADIWHVLAILYTAMLYGVWALRIEDGFSFVMQATLLSTVILVLARLAAIGFHRFSRRQMQIPEDLRHRFPGLETRTNRYVSVLNRVAVSAIYIIAAAAILQSWGMDTFLWLQTESGRHVAGAALTIVGATIIAVLVWEMAGSLITRQLAEKSGTDGRGSARAMTVLPLIQNALLVLISTLVLLVILSELGVNIGPLLAGAGVVGLAIGFGAQTLVKDIITGTFILLEDQIAVGDVVKIGSHSGVVEGMSIRTIRLRDLRATVHVIPFGEVSSIENMTKDYSRYVFKVGVAYRENTDNVTNILIALGAELQEDPEFHDLILEPLEILGVDSFDDSAVVIKARFKTVPLKQWAVGREFNRRMKKRFDELGIEIPFPHRTLYFGVDRDGTAPPAPVRMVDPSAPLPKAPELPDSTHISPDVRHSNSSGGSNDGD